MQSVPVESASFISEAQISNLKSYMTYLNSNSDQIPGDIVAELNRQESLKSLLAGDLISEIDTKMRSELAYLYDWLAQALEHWDRVIRSRMERLTKYYGKDQAVLFDGKDFNNEIEDIGFELDYPNSENALWIEEIVSVNE